MKPLQNICILNAGFPDSETQSNRVLLLAKELESRGPKVTSISLSEKKIIPCSGCWSCWNKTPGKCIAKDESHEIRKAAINSDLLMLCSPLVMGFPSARIKHVMDKMIPLILPYIELVENENHHQKRYASYPEIGLIYGKEEDTDEEDLLIIKDMMKRFSLNFKSTLSHFYDIDDPIELNCQRITEQKISKVA